MRRLAPAALLFGFFLCALPWLYLLGCQPESPLNPKGEPELRGFIVKRCYDEECLKGWLSRLSDKTGCYVLSVSSTYEAGYKAVSGVYTYTIIAECPDEPEKPVCKSDGGADVH